MDTDEQGVAAGLRRLRINKQLSAVKVALGLLGFGEDLSCDAFAPGEWAHVLIYDPVGCISWY